MGIGELNEGPLHATLKSAYAANGGVCEVAIDGFVADAVRNGIIYEIQTGSFSGLGRKLSTLVNSNQVVLVHPIAVHSTMVKLPKTNGEKIQKRKSPKAGKLIHIVNELVYLPELFKHPNFSVEVVLTKEEQIREFDPLKRRRRGGWRIKQRRLLEVLEGCRLQGPESLLDFLKHELSEPFSTRDLAQALEEPLSIAQKVAYCLRHGRVVEIAGKQGNSLLYKSLSSET